ncbi:hypothetical protein V6x_51540 [Gimesia chilikensis]|uniref:DUF2513 domain-containing protein n=1 Tax=Gimesia chilikensis TaxID=2605989 RepID=A0A517WJI0_9PLAN|nr:DUF2513 domain-containing protein [Gimesia chilikensis]QDU05417.1 hypothetical protein V6x_51540 [Gimesia chilikensis]
MDLFREILLQLESDRLPFESEPIGDWDVESVVYHKRLILEAGYANGINAGTLDPGGAEYCLTELTFNGHEFLENARSETVWAQAKRKLSDVGGTASLTVINELLKRLMDANLSG